MFSIWAGLLTWRSGSAGSAFPQCRGPWVLQHGYLYGSVELAVWRLCPSSSCVFLPPALPFFPTVSLRWQQVLYHFIWAVSSEAVLPLLQLWGRGKSQKRLHWERLCVFVCLMEEWCRAAAHFESTQEYQCSTNSVAGAEVLCSLECRCLYRPRLQEV